MMIASIIILVVVIGAFFMMRGQNQTVPTTQEQEQVVEEETTQEESADSEEVSENVIEIKDFAFGPKTITIKSGDSVTWTNRDSVGHTATADDEGGFDTGLLDKDESKTITFDKPGTYPYHCTPHPNMKAEVVVE